MAARRIQEMEFLGMTKLGVGETIPGSGRKKSSYLAVTIFKGYPRVSEFPADFAGCFSLI